MRASCCSGKAQCEAGSVYSCMLCWTGETLGLFKVIFFDGYGQSESKVYLIMVVGYEDAQKGLCQLIDMELVYYLKLQPRLRHVLVIL